MIIGVVISPVVLIVLGIFLLWNLPVIPVWAIILIVLIVALGLMGSLAICAVISNRMSPKIGLQPVEYRPSYRLNDGQPVTTGITDTEVFDTPEIYSADRPKTYKRMIGRRAVEFDAVTHQPVDPDQTSLIWRIKD